MQQRLAVGHHPNMPLPEDEIAALEPARLLPVWNLRSEPSLLHVAVARANYTAGAMSDLHEA